MVPATCPAWPSGTGGAAGVLAGIGLLVPGGHAAAGQVAWVMIAVAILRAVFAPLTGWLYGRPR